MKENETTKTATNAVSSMRWLDCPFCGRTHETGGISRHHMGELYYRYKCSGCSVSSPKMRGLDALNNWWNTRASNKARAKADKKLKKLAIKSAKRNK